jgi:putative flippase GtrA
MSTSIPATILLPKAESRLHSIAEFLRYLAASALALAVDTGTLFFLAEICHVDRLIAISVGFTVGLLVAYLLSVHWAFRGARRENVAYEFFLFSAIGIAGLLLNDFIILWASQALGQSLLVSKFISAVSVFFFNFIFRKLFLFSKRSPRV